MLRRSCLALATPARDKAKLGPIKYYSYMAWDACVHVYHGFRLIGVNSKVAWQLSRKLKSGVALTRRERVLLEKATVDLLRLLPFSVFIIVPFGEVLLPVALKMFPNMIPSTFETESQGRNRAFGMARSTSKARQRLIEYATTQMVATGHAQQRLDILRRATVGDAINQSMIKSVAPLFQPEGPLHFQKLPPDIIINLAKVTGVYSPWFRILPNSLLASPMKHRLQKKWEKLGADDDLLEKEGLADLTRDELEKVCQVRGMRWVDNTEALEEQVQAWISLSADPLVPYHTLFFFKPTANSLQDSLKTCPKEARQKLLGMQQLPDSVKEGLDRLCEKIDSKGEQELNQEESTASRARRVAKIVQDAEKSGNELDQTILPPIVEYLNAKNIEELYNEIEAEHGKVTISTTIEYLASDIHASSHIVSNVFDAMEMGDGSTLVTKSALAGLVARCKEQLEVVHAKHKDDLSSKNTVEEEKLKAAAAAAAAAGKQESEATKEDKKE